MSKVWFVTGASSGIGTGVVKAALQAGHRVVATARNLEKLRAALGEGDSERLALVKLDVTQEAQAAQAVEAAVAKFGRIDVLVNNAGYFLLGNFESFTTAQLERQFATNFYGVAHLMRAVLPVMRRQGSGHIFNISSLAGLVGFNNVSAYAATKFAVEGLSQSVAQEVEPFGIKVIAVEPGFFRTELVAAQSMDYGERAIEGYEPLATLKATWGAYHHKQQGDPAKLGKVLLELAAMEKPPRQFLAGSDAVAAYQPALEARLKEIRIHTELSKSTDGRFS
jgi:NAD(P)-dependent dehydrogenase (short-subunit alcohol dehydrogenase family)